MDTDTLQTNPEEINEPIPIFHDTLVSFYYISNS